ncbi:KUP/HAK/KT family potassium transporter [Levilactobacillus namurensis]|nr:KUP/HAK/KT family potassium transporter [Levilactobacillus namurensis]MDT7018730.1 KUP/HAK/KT family potassium transporter [Levilactobacillus namurensis]WNN66647.1 KUP/HAK/KT family potassium transporter [Levilactobacillus namurensis]
MRRLKLTTQALSGTGMLITLGIVYGDIGTSPLYVMNAILGQSRQPTGTSSSALLGSISLIFWTLMLITTIKYVILAMHADNRNEGGIFALYALVREQAAWLIGPALVGGAALLADGTLTPAVTVTSAIEGLKGQNLGFLSIGENQGVVLGIVTGILLGLFMIQRFGTARIGRSFGPIMLVWFSFIGGVGGYNLLAAPGILRALSPVYALQFLISPANRQGLFILGSIFLATTGAEALYSDMGQVGRRNIYATWPFVYTMLMLSYLGQGAWLLRHPTLTTVQLHHLNPFYSMVPSHLLVLAIILATLAAIIASQALITGSYTLVHEAIGLKLLPKLRIKFPGNEISQLYIATVNWLLCGITLSIVWYFQTSAHMEAAYGLAITLTMLMTTLLLHAFLRPQHPWGARFFLVGFGTLESLFLLASLVKFWHGGYVTLFLTLVILVVMVFWYEGNRRRDANLQQTEYVPLSAFIPQLQKLSHDAEVPSFATNLVYINRVRSNLAIKRAVIYSILDQQPKRARVYWFITVNETDNPDDCYYTVNMLGTRNVVDVQLYLGFKKPQRLNVYLRQIVNELLNDHLIDPQTPHYSSVPHRRVGNFKFIILNQQFQDLSAHDLSWLDHLLIGGRLLLQKITLSSARWYGLEFSDVIEEKVPLFIGQQPDYSLKQKKVTH